MRLLQMSLLVVLLVLAGLVLSPGAQSPPPPAFAEKDYIDGPDMFNPALDNVRQLLGTPSLAEEAYRDAVRVAEASSGAPLEAMARLLACDALLGQRSLDRTRLQGQLDRIISAFPSTNYWLAARILRICHIEAVDAPQLNQLCDQLITEIGGRPVSQIIDDVPDSPFLETQIAAAFRGHVSQLYREQAQDLSAPSQRDKVYLFLQQSFPGYQYRHHAQEYFQDKLNVAAPTWDGVPPGMPTTPDQTPPRVISQAPETGASVAPGAAVEVVLTDGSFWSSQIDPQATRLLVDGQDVTAHLIRQSQINTASRDADWEVLRLTYKPTASFSLGSHSAQLTAVDLAKNGASSNWTFTVTAQPLTMTLQVLSKHVKPRKGEVARVAVQCNRGPVNLEFRVKRGSTLVYQASAPSQAGACEFVWDGRTSAGQPAQNGNHSIEVEASDGVGGQATGSVNVQVNNNQ